MSKKEYELAVSYIVRSASFGKIDKLTTAANRNVKQVTTYFATYFYKDENCYVTKWLDDYVICFHRESNFFPLYLRADIDVLLYIIENNLIGGDLQ